MGDYRTTKPEEIWKKIREVELSDPTVGLCGGYSLAILVSLPKLFAEVFN